MSHEKEPSGFLLILMLEYQISRDTIAARVKRLS